MPAIATQEVERFLYESFRLLDAGRYDEWLALFTEDLAYVVTTVANVARGERVALVRDDRDRLTGRIESIRRFWHAEKPRTHTLHVVTNVEVEEQSDGELSVHSCFVLFATRRGRQDVLTGRYTDVLRHMRGAWRIQSRLAVLENDFIEGGKISFVV